MIPITSKQLKRLAPNPRVVYTTAFAEADEVLAKYGINDTALRLAHFMAQVLHECGRLRILQESMNYTPKGLITTFKKHRISEEQAARFGRTDAHPADQRAIANIVYGGQWGLKHLGNREAEDGWNFRGAGLLQMTGRESRERIGKALGLDLVGDPGLALDARYVLPIACEEWKEKGCNAFADDDDVEAVTKAINGAYIGLEKRKERLVETKKEWKVSS